MIIKETWQLRVTLDSISNFYSKHPIQKDILCIYFKKGTLWQSLVCSLNFSWPPVCLAFLMFSLVLSISLERFCTLNSMASAPSSWSILSLLVTKGFAKWKVRVIVSFPLGYSLLSYMLSTWVVLIKQSEILTGKFDLHLETSGVAAVEIQSRMGSPGQRLFAPLQKTLSFVSNLSKKIQSSKMQESNFWQYIT